MTQPQAQQLLGLTPISCPETLVPCILKKVGLPTPYNNATQAKPNCKPPGWEKAATTSQQQTALAH